MSIHEELRSFFRVKIYPSTLPGSIEAHLVGNLKAKLLIGMDVMGHEAFRLDLDAKKTTELKS
jgi:hypothetical protein